MPNWCNNLVTVHHEDKAEIDRMEQAFARGELLNEFIPCPNEDDWYAFNVENWGTKWDVGGDGAHCEREDDNTLSLTFDSAWSPPVEAYGVLKEMGFTIEAYYYEPGMQFAGVWIDGVDEFYQDWGDAAGAVDMLPEELDEMFAISENQAEWEAESEDWDEDEGEE